MANVPIASMTYEAYLSFERASPDKHEFAAGVVYAMSGGTAEHSAVAANVIAGLHGALRGSPCVTFNSDMRVRTGDDVATYPDVSIACGELTFTDATRDELRNPKVIVEVLSSSSEAYDRGEKFAHYQTIATLLDYVLISTESVRVEVFSRQEDGSWILRTFVEGASVHLPSVSARIPVADLYENARPRPPAAAAKST